MNRNLWTSVLTISTLAFSLSATINIQNSLAQQAETDSSATQSTTANLIAQATTKNYPVVNSVDWTSVNPQNIPWSQPVTINDPFDGNYLAVFDRNYKDLAVGGRASLVSEWSRKFIKVYGFVAVANCVGFLRCGDSLADAPAAYLEVKVGAQIFRLLGNGNGSFPVSNQLAAALANAPAGNALIRVTLSGINQPITSAIGAGTVNAWKVVYGRG